MEDQRGINGNREGCLFTKEEHERADAGVNPS